MRWFNAQADGGSFVDPSVGAFNLTPFGWGTSIFDYDADIVHHGRIHFWSDELAAYLGGAA